MKMKTKTKPKRTKRKDLQWNKARKSNKCVLSQTLNFIDSKVSGDNNNHYKQDNIVKFKYYIHCNFLSSPIYLDLPYKRVKKWRSIAHTLLIFNPQLRNGF